MNEIEMNDKLYHWLYGIMTVKGIKERYLELTVDDLASIRNDWDQEIIKKQANKTFLKSSLNHWIHTAAVNVLDTNNDFDYSGASCGMELPIEGKYLNQAINETIILEINELKSAKKFIEENETKIKNLSKLKKRLVDEQNNMKTIMQNEKNKDIYPDADVYNTAIKDQESTIKIIQSEVEKAQKDFDTDKQNIEKIMKKYGLKSMDTLLADIKHKLQIEKKYKAIF
jgi:hypothetical protein